MNDLPSIPFLQPLARLMGHNGSIFALQQGRDERHLLSAAGDGWVVEWDLAEPENGRLLARVETQLFALAYLPEQRLVVAGNMNGGVHWIDLDRPEQTRNVAHHRKGVYAVLGHGEYVFTLGGDGLLTRWSAADGRSLESIQLSSKSLRCIDFSPPRNELAVGSSDHGIYLLDADTLALKSHLPQAHENSVFALRYVPGADLLLSGGRDAHLRVWELGAQLKSALTLPAHWYTINEIVFHPQAHLFATASRDKTIKLWDASSFQLIKVLEPVRDKGHVNSVNTLLWSNYRDMLVSAGDDRSLIVWGGG